MKLKEIMTRDVEVVQPDDTLQEAAKKMRMRDVGFLPVCDGQKLVGALSDRDITVWAAADGKDPKKTQVKDLVHSRVCWCYEDQTVDESAKMMTEQEIRRVMVIGREDKQLVGVVSLGDLATRVSSKTSGNVLVKVGPH